MIKGREFPVPFPVIGFLIFENLRDGLETISKTQFAVGHFNSLDVIKDTDMQFLFHFTSFF